MIRLKIHFAYDGTEFAGWAAQPGLRTVESELTNALVTVLRVDGLRLTTAGRTDAGVHARGAVGHVDVPREAWDVVPGRSERTPAEALVTRLRGVLPPDIVVRRVEPASEGFDARFAALSRRYVYRLSDAPGGPEPLRRRDVVWSRRPLDVEAMNAAAHGLLGLHDFAAFCKRREGATTIRTLLGYEWVRVEDRIEGTVVADAFCHSMVRALVGAVVPVGEGRRHVTWPTEVLDAGRRESAVTVMPAHGLTLEEVTYPDPAEMAARVEEARHARELPYSRRGPGD